MDIRSHHWLLALGVAAIAHAALVTAVNLPPRVLGQEPTILINLGEMGAPEGTSGGGADAGLRGPEPLATAPIQALAATDSLTPLRAAELAEEVETREIVPPLVTHTRADLDRPKPVPTPKPEPAVAKTSPPKPAPVTPSARREQKEPARSSATGKGTGPATNSAGGGDRGPDVGAGAGAAGKGSGKGGSATGAGRGNGSGGKGVANYQGRLVAWLNRHKRYPDRARRLRQQGTVRVSFTIDRNGHLLSHRIVGGSGYPLLDQEVQTMLERANPMPAFPPGMSQSQFTVTVPINFGLR
jgi:periplasmic protein TonB